MIFHLEYYPVNINTSTLGCVTMSSLKNFYSKRPALSKKKVESLSVCQQLCIEYGESCTGANYYMRFAQCDLLKGSQTQLTQSLDVVFLQKEHLCYGKFYYGNDEVFYI